MGQDKTGCNFLRKSSFSKLCTIQKQTNHLSFASWNLAKVTCLFVFVLYEALKKRISSKFCILSCFVWLKSVLFNLLCVSGSTGWYCCPHNKNYNNLSIYRSGTTKHFINTYTPCLALSLSLSLSFSHRWWGYRLYCKRDRNSSWN